MSDQRIQDEATRQAPTNAARRAGAAAAQAGYAYQLDVSIFAALRLLLITKSASQITLEPANEEDLEADLAPDRPGRVSPRAQLATGSKLVVQVKLRDQPWTVGAMRALLNHGEHREPARRLLENPQTRYLLATSADASGEARELLVTDFEEPADPLGFPASLAGDLPAGSEGRVAILGGLSERRLDLEINSIMSTILRVPSSRQAACREQLRKDASARMGGSRPGYWSYDDLLSTIRAHGGHLASAPELATFVKPANFEDMLARLRERNAIVITGTSGSGKTMAARALVEHARRFEAGVDVINVHVGDDPSSMRRLSDDGPTVFYIEDPWGQYSLRGGSEAWSEQLPRLLGDARPGCRYIVTSRSDMLAQAHANEKLRRWEVELNADHYRARQLQQIYERRMGLLPIDLQPSALAFRSAALSDLETPYEVDLFFTNLAEGPEVNEKPGAFYRRLRGLAHRDAVEHVVIAYLRALGQGMPALIWGLLAARGDVERTQLIAVQRVLRRAFPGLADGLDRAFERLSATRHLRQPDRSFSFAHPSVKAGFETFLRENWLQNAETLAHLVDALVQNSNQHLDWRMETAARLVHEAISFESEIDGMEGCFEPAPTSRQAIDQWLEEGLLAPGSDFSTLLQLAADVGTSASEPSELARWFMNGFQRGGSIFIDDWQPPAFSDEWYERISSDRRSAQIAARFVTEQLPKEGSGYDQGFPLALDRIAPELTAAYLSAAKLMIGRGFDRTVEAVASGAIRDLSGFEDVLDLALDELNSINKDYHTREKAIYRSIDDGEHDAAYDEYYNDARDDGYASGQFIDAYVVAKRGAGNWGELRDHRRVSELLPHWAERVAKFTNGAPIEEVSAILDISESGEHEHLAWRAAREHWSETFRDRLVARILSRSHDWDLRRELVRCATRHALDALLHCLQRLEEQNHGYVQLIVELRVVRQPGFAKSLRPIFLGLTAQGCEIFRSLARGNRNARAVSPAALAMLEDAAEDAPLHVLEEIVPVILTSGAQPKAIIGRWLQTTELPRHAVAAAQAAVDLGDLNLVWMAIEHPRADARQIAFEWMSQRSPDPLPERLLLLASDKGRRVRRAVLEAITNRPHPDHLAVVESLTKDTWSDADAMHDEPPSFPIARDAVAALGAYGSMDDKMGQRLLGLASGTPDRRLRRVCFAVAGEYGSAEVRRRIWAIAWNTDLTWERVDALDALSLAPALESDLVEEITPDVVLKLPAPVAVSALVVVGAHAPVAAAVELIERLGDSANHRALILIGAYALEGRDQAAALRVLGLLGDNHPAGRLLDRQTPKLPRSALNDLGGVRIRDAVIDFLGDRVSKKS